LFIVYAQSVPRWLEHMLEVVGASFVNCTVKC